MRRVRAWYNHDGFNRYNRIGLEVDSILLHDGIMTIDEL